MKACEKNLVSAEDDVWSRRVRMCCQLVQPVPGNIQRVSLEIIHSTTFLITQFRLVCVKPCGQKALVIGDIKDEKETHGVSEKINIDESRGRDYSEKDLT